ncbi:hypothetical protein JB92DRAFT_3084920 [Gautieria morchelliformis]|nr:hypothetical protein JB92DRAFT_3084920 [Gautieria morchelliformis]
MSYASVTSHNAPPPSMQVNTTKSKLSRTKPALPCSHNQTQVIDDTGNKVNVVEHGFKEHPATTTSVNRPSPDSEDDSQEDSESHKKAARKNISRVEQRSSQLWERFKEQLIRPGVAGGLIGVVNVGLLGTLSYQLYTQPHLRTDSRVLGGSAAGALIILGAEGALAESYRNTAQGREEERRAREEGAALYKHAREVILRPRVFGGLLGIINLGIIGGVSYVAYDNWDEPQWDRRTVCAAAVGLLALVVGEGIVAEQYKEKEYPKRR